MTTMSTQGGSAAGTRRLQRNVGFWGLTFVSLGSIIGSGWLLGALTASSVAGPASILSWVLAAVMLLILALVHAELGGAYPEAGGTARFPSFSYGPLTGFTAGWMAWLQAVTIAPIEVEATLSYTARLGWVNRNVTLLDSHGYLTGIGIAVASVFMLLFTVINIIGVKMLSDSNTVTVIWKALVPLLTVVVLLTLTFHSGNFSAGGGFAPYGAHGIFAALPAGVVFSLQGFEQAIQMAGEARNPQRDISRAVLTATVIGTIIYLALEVAFIGALDPHNLMHGWANPIGKGNFGPYAEIASAVGAGWLAVVLYIDAVISPAGTGLVYLGASARITYAMARGRALPQILSRVSLRGVPIGSVILAFVVGEISFLPFPSWQSLVGLVTSATAIMYGFAPVALHALRLRDPGRTRPYKLPAWRLLSPLGFISANLIIYWSGFEADWKIGVSWVLGLVIFAVTRIATPAADRRDLHWKASSWVWPWFVGLLVIGKFGRYGGTNAIPNWWDLIVVTAFSLVVYFWAVRLAMSSEDVAAAIEEESDVDYVEAPSEA